MIDRMTEKNLKKYGATEQNITIYCFASGDEKEFCWMQDKRNLRVILIDEIRDSVYEQLYRYPLYANQNNTEGKWKVIRSDRRRRGNRYRIFKKLRYGWDR